jgi:hypothetical protein
MATLTYDPTPADQPEFNEAEMEALAIGEAQSQEETKMLAGKYQSAEELEKAYIELQKKLGENNDELREEEPQGRGREEEVEEPTFTDILSAASDEFYANNGQLTEETVERLTQMDSKDLLDAYLSLQSQQQFNVPDLTESEVNNIKGIVGGDEAYSSLLGWAAENLPQNYIQGFDSLINSGNADMIQLAVQGLQAIYQNNNGYEGVRLSGKAPNATQDMFRSQAEVVAAMSDPRYDRDPAYRNDVFAKLERSNLQY